MDNSISNSNNPMDAFMYTISPTVVLDNGIKSKSLSFLTITMMGIQPTEMWLCTDNIDNPFLSNMGYNSIREMIESLSAGEWTEISEEEFFKVWNEASEL